MSEKEIWWHHIKIVINQNLEGQIGFSSIGYTIPKYLQGSKANQFGSFEGKM